MSSNIYSKDQYEDIVKKYGVLFGDAPDAYRDFLDLAQPKCDSAKAYLEKMGYYPFIGSDLFSDGGKPFELYNNYAAEISNAMRGFPDGVAEAGELPKIVEKFQKSEVLEKLSKWHDHGIGTSLGINKHFDDSLLQWSGSDESMLLIIGHDWYPIAWPEETENRASYGYFSRPLEIDTLHNADQGYAQSVADINFKRSLVALINLVPGYRKEFSSTTGEIPTVHYETKARQLSSVIEILRSKFKAFKIVFWGNTVETYLFPKCEAMGLAKSEMIKLYHPSMYSNDMMESAINYARFIEEFR